MSREDLQDGHKMVQEALSRWKHERTELTRQVERRGYTILALVALTAVASFVGYYLFLIYG